MPLMLTLEASMKITIVFSTILMCVLSFSSYAQIMTSEQSSQYLHHKLSYIDACVDTYQESETACDCTFEYMRNNYKVHFYKDDAFLNENSKRRYQLLEKMTESLRVCTELERDEFAFPRRFD
jgi:hypothetical protein